MKWLVSKNNSAWGMKRDGMGNQFYTHVIDFPDDVDDTNKNQFINDNLFGGEDWKTLIEAQPEVGFHEADANKTKFRVNVSQYPNETWETLLRKDFAISKEGDKVMFWAIDGRTIANQREIIEYTAVRDWVFEVGFNKMFKDTNQVVIERAHIDDVTNDNRWNIGMNSDNGLIEEIEEFSQDQYIPTNESRQLIDYSGDISFGSVENKPTERVYYYKRNTDSVGYYDRGDGGFHTLASNLCNGGILRWFTLYKDKNKNWHIVYAYHNNNTQYFRSLNMNGVAEKSASLPSTEQGELNRVFDIEMTGNYGGMFCALLDNNHSPEVVFIDEWLTSTSNELRHEYIDIHEINGGTTYLDMVRSVSMAVGKKKVYISFGYFTGNGFLEQSWGWREHGTTTFHEIYHLKVGGSITNIARTNLTMASEAGDTMYYTLDDNEKGSGNVTWQVTIATNSILDISSSVNQASKVEPFKTTISGMDYDSSTEVAYYKNTTFNHMVWGNYVFFRSLSNNMTWISTSFGEVRINNYDAKYQFTIDNIEWDEDNYDYEYPSFYWVEPSAVNPPNITIEGVNDLLNTKGFAVVQCQLNDDGKLLLGEASSGKDITFTNAPKIKLNVLGTPIENNYYVFLLPFSKFSLDGENWTNTIFSNVYPIIQISDYVYNIRFQPFAFVPVGAFKYKVLGQGDDWYVEISITDEGKKQFTSVEAKNSDFTAHWLFKNMINDWDTYGSPQVINDASNYDTDISKNFVMNNIAKLHKYPYVRDYLKSSTGLEMYIIPQVLTRRYRIKYSWSWAPDTNHMAYKVEDLDDPNGYYNKDYVYGVIGQEMNNYGFFQTNSPFNQYMINNRSQLEQRSRKWEQDKAFAKERYNSTILQRLLGLGGASVGAVAGGALGAIGGAISGASQLGGFWGDNISYRQQLNEINNNIAMQKAGLSDLSNATNTLEGNGDDMNMVLTKAPLTPLLIHEELMPIVKEMVAWRFQQYGSRLSTRPRNINQYLDNKYHFNFIKCQSAFENYREEIPMNNETRQITDKSLAEGITIWHYRSKNTFKGIKNWDVNNVDTNRAVVPQTLPRI